MVYLDTSFLAPLFKSEATSIDVEQFIATLPTSSPAISQWVRVEFSSLLAKEVRMGGLTAAEAKETDAAFEILVGREFSVLSLTDDDFALAKRYLADHRSGLRAGMRSTSRSPVVAVPPRSTASTGP